eukprot:g20806.t1
MTDIVAKLPLDLQAYIKDFVYGDIVYSTSEALNECLNSLLTTQTTPQETLQNISQINNYLNATHPDTYAQLIKVHTFCPKRARGKGLAVKVVQAAFDYTRENNLMVDPVCSYVSDVWVPRHGQDYKQLNAVTSHRKDIACIFTTSSLRSLENLSLGIVLFAAYSVAEQAGMDFDLFN